MNKRIESRWSHLIGFCGVGSVVRADDDLFSILDTKSWTKRDGSPAGELIPYVDMVRQNLGIEKELRHPPFSQVDDGVIIGESLPACRFPGWMRCPSCGLLHWQPWRDQGSGRALDWRERFRCTCRDEKPPRLQQVGWVEVSSAGGMRDVDWHYQAHLENPSHCQLKDRLYLQRRRDNGDWQVWCGHESCKTRKHKFKFNYPIKGKVLTHQPWQKFDKSDQPTGEFETRILEVGDPNVFLPRVRSALVIPPESRVKRDTVLDRLHQNRGDRDALEQARTPLARQQKLRALATKYHCSMAEIEDALRELNAGYPLYGEIPTGGELKAKEYEAFLQILQTLSDSEDFVPRHKTSELRNLQLTKGSQDAKVAKLVSQLVQVTRLREVRIFEGFARVHQYVDDKLRQPTSSDGKNDEKQNRLIPPDLDHSLNWYPAIELFGEGIFFTLTNTVLRSWSEQPGLQQRLQKLEKRFESSGFHFPDTDLPPIQSRFVLLHTLAHLLIRQLETRAGYPAASIRERIYFSQDDPDMAGILVYVAVPDIVGSLGGLAELAEPSRFIQLLSGVFSNADWCSLDPVCNEHEGQGPNQLNLAACHACALVPETSCQFRNMLLDRVFLSGSIDGDVTPLLDFVP